jgi:hypothetical protein
MTRPYQTIRASLNASQQITDEGPAQCRVCGTCIELCRCEERQGYRRQRLLEHNVYQDGAGNRWDVDDPAAVIAFGSFLANQAEWSGRQLQGYYAEPHAWRLERAAWMFCLSCGLEPNMEGIL